jgi:hypothetical protein
MRRPFHVDKRSHEVSGAVREPGPAEQECAVQEVATECISVIGRTQQEKSPCEVQVPADSKFTLGDVSCETPLFPIRELPRWGRTRSTKRRGQNEASAHCRLVICETSRVTRNPVRAFSMNSDAMLRQEESSSKFARCADDEVGAFRVTIGRQKCLLGSNIAMA